MQGVAGDEGMITRSVNLIYNRIDALKKLGWAFSIRYSRKECDVIIQVIDN
jgi:hypothetical protein